MSIVGKGEGGMSCLCLMIPTPMIQVHSRYSTRVTFLHCSRFLVHVSYLELYNEDVRDLLSKNVQNRLEIRERADIGVYVKDLSKFSVKNPEDMDRLMAIGNKNSASV